MTGTQHTDLHRSSPVMHLHLHQPDSRQPETSCLIDAVYQLVSGLCGPDEEPASLLVEFKPFRLTLRTDLGVQVTVEAPAS